MRILVGLIAACLTAPAAAEVVSSSPTGFVIERKAVVAADPAATYAALGRIGEWWNDQHSYSGKAANMTLALEPGGCFCERWAGGAVEHMRVVSAQPGVLLRLHGGLGPLQGEGVAGALSWALKAAPGGTEITQTYVVGGTIRGSAETFAPLVDQVLGEQLAGLQALLAK